MNLAELLYLKFNADDLDNHAILQDDGEGIHIKKWGKPLGPKPTAEQLELWKLELAPAHKLDKILKKRKSEYPEIEDLIIALWEKVVENKSEAMDELEDKRQKIKNKYPKS